MRYTFKAYERLKREQHIHTLFLVGKAYSVFPVKLIYNIVPRSEGELAPVRIGFSIPKKRFKRSVDRHRIRRLLFESWRLHKHLIYAAVPEQVQVHLFFVFVDNKLPEYETLQSAVIKGADWLIENVINGLNA